MGPSEGKQVSVNLCGWQPPDGTDVFMRAHSAGFLLSVLGGSSKKMAAMFNLDCQPDRRYSHYGNKHLPWYVCETVSR